MTIKLSVYFFRFRIEHILQVGEVPEFGLVNQSGPYGIKVNIATDSQCMFVIGYQFCLEPAFKDMTSVAIFAIKIFCVGQLCPVEKFCKAVF